MTNLRTLLAFNMKEQRKSLKLSQAKLAEKIDTSTNYIAVIESGKKFPSPEMLGRIASALEIDTTDLFSLKHLPAKSPNPTQELRNQIMSDIAKILSNRIKEVKNEEKPD
jgi:transcriptional regulator with XRE-family HTH domain